MRWQRSSWVHDAKNQAHLVGDVRLNSGSVSEPLYNRRLFTQAADHYNMTPALNKPLPEFEAVATGGVKFTPQGYVGQTVVLYFYPKDHTPGCTTEAMQFRDKHKEFVKAGAVVFGVSRDNLTSHDKFKENLELPYELIADTEEKLCHMFGVVKNKIMYGKKVKGIERSTFLIGPDGVLREEWRGIKVAGHVEDVLKAVKALKQEAA